MIVLILIACFFVVLALSMLAVARQIEAGAPTVGEIIDMVETSQGVWEAEPCMTLQ